MKLIPRRTSDPESKFLEGWDRAKKTTVANFRRPPNLDLLNAPLGWKLEDNFSQWGKMDLDH